MIAFVLVALAIIAPIMLVTAFFALEVFAGLFPLRHAVAENPCAKTIIVIPAHDEEQVIGRTIAELACEVGASTVLVVADNCSDNTAGAAASAGARVVVRNDPERKGKGFALAAARELLRGDPPDVVIIVDADCRLDGASLRALCAAAASSGRACQAVNLLTPDLRAPPLVQISSLAFMIKNLVRQRGLQRLAARAHLTGTGMAFPWGIFDDADFGGSNIVEDLALGLDLSGSAAPLFTESAAVWSPAAPASGTLIQRRRWEGGFIVTSLKRAPVALGRSIIRADLRGVAAALDLSVPPLALLFMLNGVALLLCVGLRAIGGPLWPLIVQIAVLAAAVVALGLAWSKEGRRFASGATLIRLPLYIAWKLPLYLGLIRAGAPKEWLRTGR